jgi:hypothetical protein
MRFLWRGEMATLEGMTIPGFDPASGTFMLPLWVVALAALVFIILFAVAVVRSSLVGSIALGLRLAIVVLIAWGAWLWVDHSAKRDQADERRALQARAVDLTIRAAAPGSPLACLEAAAGETVEAACERVLFANVQTVAAATALVGERLALLADIADYSTRTNASDDDIAPGLRQTLERDRFGLVAQVLAVRDGCTPDACDAVSLFRDATRVQANLKDKPFDSHVARYSNDWLRKTSEPDTPTASIPVVPPTVGTIAPLPPTPGAISPVPPGFSLPSAASIPPVSIMTPEPAAAAPPPAATATPPAEPDTAAASPQKRRTNRAPKGRAAQTAPPPVQITPPAATGIQPQ